MTTIIHSNGSKWAVEKDCTIEELIDVLKNHERFACHGFVNFIDRDYEQSKVHIHGSHVFNIDGIYENLKPLINAIESNIKRQCDSINLKG